MSECIHGFESCRWCDALTEAPRCNEHGSIEGTFVLCLREKGHTGKHAVGEGDLLWEWPKDR